DLPGSAIGDDAPFVKDGDSVGQPEDDIHVVLDDEDRQRPIERGDELRDPRSLRGRHPGGRLVEQQDLRSLRARDRKPELAALPAVGESSPVRTLNSVVLPAPFGPMTARRSPARTASVTPSKARTPPKVRVRS